MKPLNSKKTGHSRLSLISFPIEKCIYCIAVLIGLSLISNQSSAQSLQQDTDINILSAVSVGGLKNDSKSLITELKEKKQQLSDALPKQNMTRDQKIKSKASAKNLNNNKQRSYYYDFAFYSGYSTLFDDDDGDGYYNTFGVSFDADIISPDPYQQVSVYAEIYLSQNGGPWIHLHTTDSFMLYSDSTDDEYEVVTQLTANYEPDHYNVLIDLYESGYDGIVATYSDNDTNSFYALPLESQDWEYHDDHHHDHHGGTYSFAFLLFLVFVTGLKLWNQNIKGINQQNA